MKLTIEIDRGDDSRRIAGVPAIPGVLVYGPSRQESIARVPSPVLRVLADRVVHVEDLAVSR